MSFLAQFIQNGSDSNIFCSEQVIIEGIYSFVPSFLIAIEPETASIDKASTAQVELVIDNLINRSVEPEDDLLVNSNILQHLIAQAQQEVPSSDWEHELDEL